MLVGVSRRARRFGKHIGRAALCALSSRVSLWANTDCDYYLASQMSPTPSVPEPIGVEGLASPPLSVSRHQHLVPIV